MTTTNHNVIGIHYDNCLHDAVSLTVTSLHNQTRHLRYFHVEAMNLKSTIMVDQKRNALSRTVYTYHEVVCWPDSLVGMFVRCQMKVNTILVEQIFHAVSMDAWQTNSNLWANHYLCAIIDSRWRKLYYLIGCIILCYTLNKQTN